MIDLIIGIQRLCRERCTYVKPVSYFQSLIFIKVIIIGIRRIVKSWPPGTFIPVISA